MPTTYLADLRGQVRIDLHDEDASAYRWTDATLARHIARGLQEYSAANPLTAVLTINCTADVRAYALTATAITLRPEAVIAVEWPYLASAPAYPANLVNWRIFADTLYLLTTATPAAGEVIRVWYTTEHTLSDSTRTFPPEDAQLIALGAAAYAALERETYAAERITIDDQTAQEYQRWGTRAMTKWTDEMNFRKRSHAQSANTRQTWDTSDL